MNRDLRATSRLVLLAVLLPSMVSTARAITAPKHDVTTPSAEMQVTPGKGPFTIDWEMLLPDKGRTGFELEAVLSKNCAVS